METGLFVLIGVVVLSAVGIPIAFSIGILTMGALVYSDLALLVVPQKLFTGMDSIAMLSIPFFMFAGTMMARNITNELINISNAFIGHLKGSVAVVTIAASALFGAITGSAVATCSAIGGTTIPAMKKEGYPPEFAASVAATGSILGPIIPPSISLIVYASATNLSVAKLFIASLPGGILIALTIGAYVLWYSKKHNFPSHEKTSTAEKLTAMRTGIFALILPVIILGSIFGGICTATEAAAIAVVYTLVISFIVYRDLRIKDLPDIATEAMVSTASIMLLVGLSKASTYVIVTSRLPQAVTSLMATVIESKFVLLLIINFIFFILGMLVETNSCIIMMTPILTPLMTAFGVDLIHFGIIMSTNLCVGLLTPPVGTCLLMGNTISKARFSQTLKQAVPMISICFAVVILLTYCEPLVMFLPNLLSA